MSVEEEQQHQQQHQQQQQHILTNYQTKQQWRVWIGRVLLGRAILVQAKKSDSQF
jgi:hypothetical protein